MQKKNNSYFWIVFFVYILLFKELLDNNHYFLTILMTIASIAFLLLKNSKKIINKIYNFDSNIKKVKNLDYYKITDDDKKEDLKERKDTYSFFSEVTISSALILFINIIFFMYLINMFFDNNKLLQLITPLIIIIIGLVLFSGMIIGIIYKHTNLLYISIPIFVYAIVYEYRDIDTKNDRDLFFAAIILVISLILYFLLILILPPHVLRRLSSKTAIISVSLAILTFISTQFLIPSMLSQPDNAAHITIKVIKESNYISKDLKRLFINNPALIDTYNYLRDLKDYNKEISEFNIDITSMTIAYTLGGLIVNWKNNRNKEKAKHIYRNEIMRNTKVKYKTIIQCAFYGGEEYENLLLNNNHTRAIILENEQYIIGL